MTCEFQDAFSPPLPLRQMIDGWKNTCSRTLTRKERAHITSHHISADGSPRETPAAEFRREVRQMPIGQVEKKFRCFGKHRGAKCGGKISCGQSRIYLGLSWRRTQDVAATRGSVDLNNHSHKSIRKLHLEENNLVLWKYPHFPFHSKLSGLLFIKVLL